MKGETIKGRQGKRGGGAEAEAEGGGERDEVTVEGPFSSGSSSLVFLRSGSSASRSAVPGPENHHRPMDVPALPPEASPK